jgi:hypothetical protein
VFLGVDFTEHHNIVCLHEIPHDLLNECDSISVRGFSA